MEEKQIQRFNPEEIACISTTDGLVGEGSFGVVRLAFHDVYGAIAVKCTAMKGGRSETKLVEKTIKREIGHLQKASHENVVRVYGWTQWTGSIALVMEYLPTGNLKHVLLDHDVDITMYLRLRFCFEVANGIAFLHTLAGSKRIVHGDIKPENIILTEDLHCKIADFGGATLRSHTGAITSVNTLSTNPKKKKESVQYTELYAPPEFLLNPMAKITTKHDTYSFAITVHMILTREPPLPNGVHIQICLEGVKHNGHRPDTQAISVQKEQLRKLDEDQYRILVHLEKEMYRCWEHDPNERPAMTKVRGNLRKLLVNCKIPIIQQHVADALKSMNVEKPLRENYKCVSIDNFLPPNFAAVERSSTPRHHAVSYRQQSSEQEDGTLFSRLSGNLEEKITPNSNENTLLATEGTDPCYEVIPDDYESVIVNEEKPSLNNKEESSWNSPNQKQSKPRPRYSLGDIKKKIKLRERERSCAKQEAEIPAVARPIPAPRRCKIKNCISELQPSDDCNHVSSKVDANESLPPNNQPTEVIDIEGIQRDEQNYIELTSSTEDLTSDSVKVNKHKQTAKINRILSEDEETYIDPVPVKPQLQPLKPPAKVRLSSEHSDSELQSNEANLCNKEEYYEDMSAVQRHSPTLQSSPDSQYEHQSTPPSIFKNTFNPIYDEEELDADPIHLRPSDLPVSRRNSPTFSQNLPRPGSKDNSPKLVRGMSPNMPEQAPPTPPPHKNRPYENDNKHSANDPNEKAYVGIDDRVFQNIRDSRFSRNHTSLNERSKTDRPHTPHQGGHFRRHSDNARAPTIPRSANLQSPISGSHQPPLLSVLGMYLTPLPLRRTMSFSQVASKEKVEKKGTLKAVQKFFTPAKKPSRTSRKDETDSSANAGDERRRTRTGREPLESDMFKRAEYFHSTDYKPILPPNHPSEMKPRAPSVPVKNLSFADRVHNKIQSIKCRLTSTRTFQAALREINELINIDPASVTGDCEMIVDEINEVVASGILAEDEALFSLMYWCMDVCDNITDRNRVLHKLQCCVNANHIVAVSLSKKGKQEMLQEHMLSLQQESVDRIKLVTTLDLQYKTEVQCWALLYVACCHKFLGNKQEAIKICKKAINKMMEVYGEKSRLRSIVATCYRLMAELTSNAAKTAKIYEEIEGLYESIDNLSRKAIHLEGVYNRY